MKTEKQTFIKGTFHRSHCGSCWAFSLFFRQSPNSLILNSNTLSLMQTTETLISTTQSKQSTSSNMKVNQHCPEHRLSLRACRSRHRCVSTAVPNKVDTDCSAASTLVNWNSFKFKWNRLSGQRRAWTQSKNREASQFSPWEQRHTQTDRERWMHTSCLFCLYGGCVSVSRSAMPKTNGERVGRLYINAFSQSRYHCNQSVLLTWVHHHPPSNQHTEVRVELHGYNHSHNDTILITPGIMMSIRLVKCVCTKLPWTGQTSEREESGSIRQAPASSHYCGYMTSSLLSV